MEIQKIVSKENSSYLGSFIIKIIINSLGIEEVDKIYTDNKFLLTGYRINCNN